jgi:hypothetical protein
VVRSPERSEETVGVVAGRVQPAARVGEGDHGVVPTFATGARLGLSLVAAVNSSRRAAGSQIGAGLRAGKEWLAPRATGPAGISP